MGESEVLPEVCRICLKTETELESIFEGQSLSQLTYCFPLIQILQNDGLPQKICQICSNELAIVVNFKQKLENSDAELRSIIANQVKKVEEPEEDQEIGVKLEPNLADYDFGFEPTLEEDDHEDEEEDQEEVSKFQCKNCKIRFGSQELADEHVETQKCFTNLTCNICQVKLKTRKGLRRHYKAAIHASRLKGEKPKSINQENDDNEEKTLSVQDIFIPNDLTCPVCSKKCNSKIGYRRHAKIHAHKKYSCQTCHREFSRTDQLHAHLKIHDNESPKFECDICGKSYHLKSILREHIRIHTRESLALCSFCGKSFTSKSNLKQHILRHTNTKQFECTDCGKKFVSKGELKGHIRIHTGEHPYVCDVCGIKFTMSYSLKKHKRTHTGERPYPCEFCPKSFKILETLKIHRRIHTGEKPYACSFCGRTFTQKNDMIKHERIHTGERLYGCNLCGKRFVQASTLNTHIKGVHKGAQQQQQQSTPASQPTTNQPPPSDTAVQVTMDERSHSVLSTNSSNNQILINPTAVVNAGATSHLHGISTPTEYHSAAVMNE